MSKAFRPYAAAAILALIEAGLQVSGITNTALAICLWGAAGLIGVGAIYHDVREWHRQRVIAGNAMSSAQITLLGGLLGLWLSMTVTLGAAAWIIWHQQGFAIGASPISVGAPADEGPMQWFKNLTMEGGALQGRNVFSLQFRGWNASQKEVRLKDANIISALNGAKIPLEVIVGNEVVPIDQIELIPPGAAVQLVAKFGPPDPNAPGKILGLEPKTFLETWSRFSLNVEDDTKSYRISFNEGDLAAFFPGMVGPHVSKKATPNAKQ